MNKESSIYESALALRPVLLADRRRLHQIPETGNDLPQTTAYIISRLKELGYTPREICKGGIVAEAGKPGRTILLRADMDALPIQEESGEPFASVNGRMHACGHDFHSAMLLGAAAILKTREKDLKGTVKLMFQPAEEIFRGARAMIDAGLLENPKVDCALACHVLTDVPEGKLNISLGPAASACAGFRITITGSGTHGAMPDRGVDPINIGVHIYLALQSIVSRETPLIDGSLITIGSFNAGDAANVIPQTAVLQGTMRSFNNKTREFVINRIRETVLSTAETFRGKARFEILSDIPCVMNDTAFSEKICSYISGIKDLPLEIIHSDPFLGSEDFAFVANAVPSAMVFIGAPPADKTRCFPQHHPKVVFDENVLPSGAAVYAESGFRWLEENG